jgi:hypothetical protein
MNQNLNMSSFFDQPQSLPIPCGCGETNSEQCDQVGLYNHRNFPPFAHIPDQGELDHSEDYYKKVGFSVAPRRHWALVGEITSLIEGSNRRIVQLKTKFGESVRVIFQLNNNPIFFEWDQVVVASTVCILYAEAGVLMDQHKGSVVRGVRQQDASQVMVFPASLQVLGDECTSLLKLKLKRQCFACGKNTNTDTDTDVKARCSKCSLAYYCNRECQGKHWKRTHRKLCPHMDMLSKFVQLDFNKFDDHFDWSFEKRLKQ